ncbi:hypothetical protein ABPG74_021941 [Tetrahymena malaccensis]
MSVNFLQKTVEEIILDVLEPNNRKSVQQNQYFQDKDGIIQVKVYDQYSDSLCGFHSLFNAFCMIDYFSQDYQESFLASINHPSKYIFSELLNEQIFRNLKVFGVSITLLIAFQLINILTSKTQNIQIIQDLQREVIQNFLLRYLNNYQIFRKNNGNMYIYVAQNYIKSKVNLSFRKSINVARKIQI